MRPSSRAPWQDGRRAWTRLNGQHTKSPNALPGHPDEGGAALTTLSDVDLVRGLLDRAEIVTVMTAHRHGRTSAEIGTQPGMSRQAAWDKVRRQRRSSTPITAIPSRRCGSLIELTRLDPARKHRPIELEPLTNHLQTKLVETAVRAEIRAHEVRLKHVEVF